MDYERIARIAHEMNRRWCELMGDTSQPPWEQAADWQKESAVNGVHFHADHPESGPEASHESWMQEKIADGWTYGPRKDPVKKEHPCMVPYGQLPAIQRAKDTFFLTVVKTLLE
jgi:hypothetical protein